MHAVAIAGRRIGPDELAPLLTGIRKASAEAWVVGEVLPGPSGRIVLRK